MWLLDTATLRPRQGNESSSEKYAILSHTWEDGVDMSFQADMAGFHKVDTCCTDQTSSAELSEAVNSMFRWYRESYVCYVYLSDFQPLPSRLSEQSRRELTRDQLRQCRCFTRAWTLQELIAPARMEFFDRDWNFIGGKDELQSTLSDITNVDRAILEDSSGLPSIPIARKMSWAAYSLLGIFDINLPLLCGEGSKAVLRLQQQIASQNNDLSLFAWQYDDQQDVESPQFGGLLANSSEEFRHCYNLKRHADQFQVA
ncbi:hypothetical protein B0H63DRAFT_500676 [Podospora didyma]|uniref:Vegetative incompatibility protein HET-E-1 n=1 Tax=Podospora didyma TaxID=330526 RepID=A0AAE0NTC0_9PEZI|nr:hypothetical protein B0H63DRAFT_500676 [Podospora didyma]